jgi:hypothetical protein
MRIAAGIKDEGVRSMVQSQITRYSEALDELVDSPTAAAARLNFDRITAEMENLVDEAADLAVSTAAHQLKIQEIKGKLVGQGITDPLEQLRAIRDTLESPAAVNRRIRPIEGMSHAMHLKDVDFNLSMQRMEDHMGQINPSLKQIITQDLDSQLADDFVLYAAGGKPATENPEAAEFARIWKEESKAYIDRIQAAGGEHGFLDNFVTQKADPAKVLTSKEEYIDFLVENMDRNKHTNLREEAESIYMGITHELDDPDGTSAIVKDRSRKLHLASAEAQLEYLKRFGQGTVMEQMTNNLHSLATKANLVENWGPQPFLAIDTLTKDILNEMDPAQKLSNKTFGKPEATHLSRQIEVIKNEWEGRYNIPRNARVAAVGQMARDSFSAAFLGKTVLFSLTSDIALGAHNLAGARRGIVSGSTAYNMAKVIGRIATGPDAEAKRIARSLGAYQHHIVGGMSARLGAISGTDGIVTGSGTSGILGRAEKTMHRLAMNNFKYTGTNFIANRTRAASAVDYMMNISDHAGMSFKDLSQSNPILHKRLVESGFSDGLWDAISNKGVVADSGRMIDIDKIDAQDPKAARRLRAFIHREASFAVQSPDAMARAALKGATLTGSGQGIGRRGSLAGEATLFATQFQSAPMMIFRNNVTRSLREGKGRTAALVGALGATMALKVQLDEAMSGREMWDWDDPLFHLKVFDATGLSWIVGNMAYQAAANKRIKGQADLEFSGLAGPMFGTLYDTTHATFDVFGDMIDRSGLPSREVMDKAAGEFLSVAPWQNNLTINLPFYLMFRDSMRNVLLDKDNSGFDQLIKDN